MGTFKHKGIFCLEGGWEKDLRGRTTVGPVLELLETSHYPSIRFIHRDVATPGEMEHYLQRWILRKYEDYPILYLGFHGDPGILYMRAGQRNPVELDWIGERLEGACKGRVIHFGSCGTLAAHGNKLNHFLHQTEALAVSGYRTDVDWIQSAAFELVLLSAFQFNTFTRQGLKAALRRVMKDAGTLARVLKYRMVFPPVGR
jgi:hypothetical protein